MKGAAATPAPGRRTMLLLGLVGASCHLVFPYEAGQARRDAAVTEGGVADGPMADGLAHDAPTAEQGPRDGPMAEGLAADGPAADGGVTCARLAVAASAPWQVSNGATTNGSAGPPAIAWAGGSYFVAYAQENWVHAAQVDVQQGVTVRQSVTGTTVGPTITTDGQNTLVMAWDEGTPGACDRSVHVHSATLTPPGITPHGTCVASSSCPTQPYGPVALAYAGGQFLLAAGLAAVTDPGACVVGAGAKSFFFSQPSVGCPLPSSWPPCADGPLVSGTRYFAVSPRPSGGPFDFALLSLVPASAVSYGVTLHYYDGVARQWLNSGFAEDAGAGRPALADDGAGRWLAWGSLSRSALAVAHLGPVTASLPLPAGAGYVALREPALAVRPPGNAGVLLAYSAWRAGSLEPYPAAIYAGLLAAQGNSINGPPPLAVVAPPAALAEQPRMPAVAASPDGFGVAWLQNVDGRAEVFFQSLACLP